MKLEIKGQKYLNSNQYQSIRIKSIKRDIQRALVQVRPFLKSELGYFNETIKLSGLSFMEEIRDLSEIEKIKEIAEYYNRNNSIHSVTTRNGLHFIGGNHRPLYNRHLLLELGLDKKNKLYLADTIQRLMQNYFDNRLCFLDKYKKCQNYHIFGGTVDSCYWITNKEICLSLFRDEDGNLLELERNFLEQWLLERMNMECLPAEVTEYSSSFSVVCGSLGFQFRSISEKDFLGISELVHENNEKYRKQNEMQLKLDLGGI